MKRHAVKRFRWWRKGDFIVAVRPERCAGPGWANAPIWVVVRDVVGALREECIQPEEQTKDMLLLFDVAHAAHSALLAAVMREVES